MGSFYYTENCSTSLKVLGVMSRCYKIHSYSYKRSIYTKCVSEILQPQTHNNKRVLGGKTWNGFVIAKSLDKYEQKHRNMLAITVVLLHTRLPMTESD